MKKALHEAILETASVYESYIDGIIDNRIKDESERARFYISLRKEGCDIRSIILALFSVVEKWHEKTGFSELTVDLSDVLKRQEIYKAKKQVLDNSLTFLSNLPRVEGLAGYLPKYGIYVNERLLKMQEAVKDFQEISNEYAEHSEAINPPYPKELTDDDYFVLVDKSNIFKQDSKIKKRLYDNNTKGKATKILKLRQSTRGVWGDAVVGIVDELIRIKYSQRQAFIKTGKILKELYPRYYKDDCPERVKRIYKYHKSKGVQSRII